MHVVAEALEAHWAGGGFELILPESPSASVQFVSGSPAHDYALLKVTLSGRTRVPCVPAATSAPGIGTPVWAIGFPMRVDVGGHGFDSDGIREFTTLGRVGERGNIIGGGDLRVEAVRAGELSMTDAQKRAFVAKVEAARTRFAAKGR